MTHITEKQVMERHAGFSQQKNIERAVSNTAVDYSSMLMESATHSDESLKLEEDKQIISDLTESVADLKEHVELLEFQLAESKDNAAGWKRRFDAEYECSAMWRSRFLDMQCNRDELAENKKEAQRLMDKALAAAYQDEQLAIALATKFVTVSKRNLEVN